MERFYLLFIFQKTKPNPNLKNELILLPSKRGEDGYKIPNSKSLSFQYIGVGNKRGRGAINLKRVHCIFNAYTMYISFQIKWGA